MKPDVSELGLGIEYPGRSNKALNFRPPHWPPPRDWAVSIDKDGNIVSRWGDPFWDLTPLAGTIFKINFGDAGLGQAEQLDPENADLLRLAMTWVMWGRRAARTWATIQYKFTTIRGIIAACSRNGIKATALMRHPDVLQQVADSIPASRYEAAIAEFHRLYDARGFLGFTILDGAGLKRLAEVQPEHNVKQTPYIPPRIWLYQIERLRECIDDFLKHQSQIVDCFVYCLRAYEKNYGSLAEALRPNRGGDRSPFNYNCAAKPGAVFLGAFAETLSRFQLQGLLQKWLADEEVTVRSFSTYLTMVSTAGVMYIANFTLQRKEEAAALRSDCLRWEVDAQLGRVLLVCGETTKTIQDSDARWVASPSVEAAVHALSMIARLRMRFAVVSEVIQPSVADQSNPYLFAAPTEPWASGIRRAYGVRSELQSIKEVMRDYPSLFDEEVLRITSDDLTLARRVTPTLDDDDYGVGQVWPLAWHQLRRTVAVNMFASGLISDSSMQQQMKHASRLMPLYYGRNYTRLLLNGEVESMVINAMYTAIVGADLNLTHPAD